MVADGGSKVETMKCLGIEGRKTYRCALYRDLARLILVFGRRNLRRILEKVVRFDLEFWLSRCIIIRFVLLDHSQGCIGLQ